MLEEVKTQVPMLKSIDDERAFKLINIFYENKDYINFINALPACDDLKRLANIFRQLDALRCDITDNIVYDVFFDLLRHSREKSFATLQDRIAAIHNHETIETLCDVAMKFILRKGMKPNQALITKANEFVRKQPTVAENISVSDLGSANIISQSSLNHDENVTKWLEFIGVIDDRVSFAIAKSQLYCEM